ncbi:MAG: winged helix-turn-helix transcriptional regulator [Planctomycetota bacterium]|nr:winged helix-turn-helix transcriptional regulator [Planctomycetota bacterium]
MLTQFNGAVAFLKRHLNVRGEIRGVNREDIYEIPLEALREAVVNALMHRDYGITGTRLSVEVYDDRVEIVNPGGLPNGLSIREFGTVSIRRNEVIADLFFRPRKVERIGMGIQKMKEVMIAAGLREPSFEPDGFFRAVFHRSPEFAMKEEVTTRGDTRRETEETREMILGLIRANPGITRVEMAEKIGLTMKGIDWNISRLKKAGRLRRVGPTKGGNWKAEEK